VAVGGNPCDVLSLLSSLELCCAGSSDCGGVGGGGVRVYVHEAHGPCVQAHLGLVV
jgi:hypothetical protein